MGQQDGSDKVLAVEARQLVINPRTPQNSHTARRRGPASQKVVLCSSQVRILPPSCTQKKHKNF